MTSKQKAKVESLVSVIQKNPTLPIFPVVAAEVVPGDDYSEYLGDLGMCYVDEVCSIEGVVFFKRPDDWDEIESALILEYGRVRYEEMEDYEALNAYDELPWSRAIILNIIPL